MFAAAWGALPSGRAISGQFRSRCRPERDLPMPERLMKHIARKRFGQHFLTDRLIIQGIVDAIAPLPGQPMVEIGPGLAALTQPLVERLGHLTVIRLGHGLASNST